MNTDFNAFQASLTDKDYRDIMKPIEHLKVNLPLSNAENVTDLINQLQVSQIATTMAILKKYHQWIASHEAV